MEVLSFDWRSCWPLWLSFEVSLNKGVHLVNRLEVETILGLGLLLQAVVEKNYVPNSLWLRLKDGLVHNYNCEFTFTGQLPLHLLVFRERPHLYEFVVLHEFFYSLFCTRSLLVYVKSYGQVFNDQLVQLFQLAIWSNCFPPGVCFRVQEISCRFEFQDPPGSRNLQILRGPNFAVGWN